MVIIVLIKTVKYNLKTFNLGSASKKKKNLLHIFIIAQNYNIN